MMHAELSLRGTATCFKSHSRLRVPTGSMAGCLKASPALSSSISISAVAAAASATAPSATATQRLPDLNSIKGVLFDIDGTLTNSDPLHFIAFQEILVELNYNNGESITEEFFRQRISGRHNPEIAADLFPSWPEDMRVQFYEDKEARFRKLAGSVLKPIPGLKEMHAWIDAKGLRKAAVTNAPRANTELMLQALGLGSYFEAVVLGEECSRAKPFPEPYLRGLDLLGLDPHEALVVEDSPAGLSAAVAAGIPAVGILTGQPEEALLKAGACHIIRDYHELLALVK